MPSGAAVCLKRSRVRAGASAAIALLGPTSGRGTAADFPGSFRFPMGSEVLEPGESSSHCTWPEFLDPWVSPSPHLCWDPLTFPVSGSWLLSTWSAANSQSVLVSFTGCVFFSQGCVTGTVAGGCGSG